MVAGHAELSVEENAAIILSFFRSRSFLVLIIFVLSEIDERLSDKGLKGEENKRIPDYVRARSRTKLTKDIRVAVTSETNGN